MHHVGFDHVLSMGYYMSYLQLALIALVQGITEWLPISSSAHVLLAADYFGLDGPEELLINAMAHLGTLGAILIYFWKDFVKASVGSVELVSAPMTKKPLSEAAHLALMIIVATPVALAIAAGWEIFADDAVKDSMRNVYVVAGSTVFFGALLWWADVKGKTHRTEKDMTMKDAFLIGITQPIAALIPGTSRSGITMTASRALGFSREEAARFSMLIGAPMLAAVGAYAFLELTKAGGNTGDATLMDGLYVAALSFVSGIVSIAALMAILKRMSFLPFVLYRFALGGLLLLMAPHLMA